MNPKPNFVFFGTPYVARDTLAHLIAHDYVPSLVVTSPDAPRGRGLTLTPCETKVFAQEQGLAVISPERLSPDVLEEIRATDAQFAIVVAYGKFLPEPLLHLLPLGALNVHYSLLPKYRGASPVEASLLNDDTVTGVSIQKMVKEMDAGDVLVARELEIEPNETTRELRPRLITLGAQLLVEILPAYLRGELAGTPQNPAEITFAKKIAKTEGELDLKGDAKQNWNKYRAFAESPGTYFFKDGKRIKIKTATFENGIFTPLRVVPEGKNEINFGESLR
jgi:methionyl-tRNA formyltransferase